MYNYYGLDPISALLLVLLDLYWWVVVVAVVLSWLVAFNVVNLHNDIVRMVARFLGAITEPVFRLVRRFIPAMGGIDFSPLIVLLGIWFVRYAILWVHTRWLY